MKEFSFEAYTTKSCIRGIPVLTTKWHIKAKDAEEAKAIAEKICTKLTHGNTKNQVKFQNLKEDENS